ncbi:MAG: fasciclin domain-containing protein [Jatrophihabitans sp.]|uniref:fasciclin domain-containing protein n=1 Tax=Jatrophihabitans sp. TaxID=1932789 RepID=UPI003F81377A
MRKITLAATGSFAALAVALTGCSSSGGGSTNTSSAPAGAASTSATSSDTMTSTPAAPSSGASGAGAATFGSACGAVPKTGAGSFDGMATDPVATAASNNPVLSTLVSAVKAAGLVDTLNSQQAITVFAPYNGAFANIPKATLDSVLKDKALLTKILTYHVVAGKISPDQLPGTHKTLEGDNVVVKGSAPDLTVGPNGTEAHVICGNVQTANATVYIIDSVMMPPTK